MQALAWSFHCATARIMPARKIMQALRGDMHPKPPAQVRQYTSSELSAPSLRFRAPMRETQIPGPEITRKLLKMNQNYLEKTQKKTRKNPQKNTCFCNFWVFVQGILDPFVGDRDRGGSNLRKLEGGWNFWIFGEFDPCLQRFYSPQFGSQKCKLSKDNFRGKFPHPLAFGTFWPPLSRSPILGNFRVISGPGDLGLSHWRTESQHQFCRKLLGRFCQW